MGDELTLDKVNAAADFGPRLCGPVAHFIRAFHRDLPAEDVFMFTTEWRYPIYLKANSGLISYYHNALLKFKTLLSKAVRPDFFVRHYDPAIAFFKTNLERGAAIRLSCRGGARDTTPPVTQNLSGENNLNTIKRYLQRKFGFKFEVDVEKWLGHRVFFSRIKESNDLVLIMLEDHGDMEGAEDQMKLFEHILERKDRFEIRLASEFSSDELNRHIKDTKTNEYIIKTLKPMRERGAGPQRMFELFNQDGTLKELCAQMVKDNPGLSLENCRSNAVLPTMKRVIFIIYLGTDKNNYWPLDDVDLKRKNELVLTKLHEQGLPHEKRFALQNENHTLMERRSTVMTKRLAENLRKEKGGKKLRIIIFPVGAAHASDVISYLQKNSSASILGLMPSNYARHLDGISETPE